MHVILVRVALNLHLRVRVAPIRGPINVRRQLSLLVDFLVLISNGSALNYLIVVGGYGWTTNVCSQYSLFDSLLVCTCYIHKR